MITIVTGLFNLSRRDPRKELSFNRYLRLSEHVLSLPYRIVIYTDPEGIEPLTQIRKKFDPDLFQTELIGRPLEKFGFDKYRSKIVSNDTKCTINYYLTVWTKFLCLEETIRNTPDGHIFWLDIGLFDLLIENSNLRDGLEDYLKNPLDKIRILQRLYINSNVAQDGYHKDGMAAGFFGGSIEAVNWLVNTFKRTLASLIEEGKTCLVEEILERIWVQEPDRFHCYYGNYRSIFNNLVSPVNDFAFINRNILQVSRLNSDPVYAVKAGNEIWPYRQAMLTPDLIDYLDEYLVSRSMIGQQVTEIGQELAEIIPNNPDDRIVKNLKCLNISVHRPTLTLVTIFEGEEKTPILDLKIPIVVFCLADKANQALERMTKLDPQLVRSILIQLTDSRMLNKLHCLQIVSHLNPFKTTRLAWSDIQLDLSGLDVSKVHWQIKLMSTGHDSYSTEFFSGDFRMMRWFHNQLAKKIDLKDIILSNPNYFDLYYESHSNISRIYFDHRKLVNYLTNSRITGHIDYALQLGNKLWEDRSLMLDEDLSYFLDEYLVIKSIENKSSFEPIVKELIEVFEYLPKDYQTRVSNNIKYLGFEAPSVKITLITCFFDLARRDVDFPTGRRSPETYLTLAEKMTLGLHYPMVIYCDPDYADRIRNIRLKLTSAPTEIIPKPFEAYEYERYRSQVVDSICNGKLIPLREKWPWKITPNYCLITWTKMAFFADVISRNPFKGNRFVWIDLGLAYLKDENPKLGEHFLQYLDNFSSRIKITQRWYVNEHIVDQIGYFTGDGFAFAGGFFGGSAKNILWLKERFDEQIHDLLDRGLSLLEEQIIGRIYAKYPDRFNLSYGNYCNLIDNLDKVNQNYSWVVNQMMNRARTCGDLNTSAKIGDFLWSDRSRMTPDELLVFLDEYFVCSYNKPIGYQIGKELANVVNLAKDQENAKRIRNNLKVLGISLSPTPIENVSDVTLVTAFYDLSKRENRRAKVDFYLKNCRSTLMVNLPMVIYCDPELSEKISKIRKLFSSAPTKIISKPLEEMKSGYEKYRKQVIEAYSPKGNMGFMIDNLPEQFVGKFTANYCILTWSKLAFLHNTIQVNPYKTNKFVWIDFGLGHLAQDNPLFGTYFPGNIHMFDKKVRLVQRLYPNKAIVDNIKKDPWATFSFCGGIFGGPGKELLWLREVFDRTVSSYLSEGMAPLEEQILTKIYVENTDRFDVSYGNYYNLIDNLEYPHHGSSHILYGILIPAMNDSNYRAVVDCGSKMWVVRNSMSDYDKRQLTEIYFNSLVELKDDRAKEIGLELAKYSDLSDSLQSRLNLFGIKSQ